MFAKVFSQILDSSVAADYRVRLVFEDFLKLADKDGIVDITPDAISRRTNVPIEIVVHGIGELEKPDPISRTPDEDGRRIVRLDEHRAWGWKIVNFRKYRESASKEMLRMSEADRKAEYRKRHGKGFPIPLPKEEKIERQRQTCPGSVPDCPGHVPDKSPDTQSIFPQLEEIKTHAQFIGCPPEEAEKFFHHFDASGWIDKNGHAIRNWKSKLQTWAATARSSPAEAAHRRNEGRFDKPQKPGFVATEIAALRKELEKL